MPPISLISPIWMVNAPEYSLMLRMKAATIMAPIYTGKVIPVSDSAQDTSVPRPMAMAI